MGLWVIVPVKPLRRGKSRLAGVLSEEERTLLNYTMLVNILTNLKEVQGIDTVLVVSRDTAALSLAREHGARTVQEESRPELNTALQRATEVAKMYSAEGVLVLPADLPMVKAEDIQDFIRLCKAPPELIIAPDRRKDGTNAFLVRPVGIVPYSYGPGSYQRHLKYAEEHQIQITVCGNPAFELDIDYPEDLELYRKWELEKSYSA